MPAELGEILMFSFRGYRLLAPKELDRQFFDEFKTFAPFFKTKPPMVFDVGANTGQSVRLYKKQWQDCEIHAFEPQEKEFLLLKEMACNYRDVTCNNMAIGAERGEAPFIRHNLYPAASSFYPVNACSAAVASNIHPKASFQSLDFSTHAVKVETIDSYVAENKIQHIDILKVDVQGYEPQVLRGAEESISNGMITFINSEIMLDDVYQTRPSFSAIEAILSPHGFRLYDISHVYKDIHKGRTHWVDAVYANSRVIRF